MSSDELYNELRRNFAAICGLAVALGCVMVDGCKDDLRHNDHEQRLEAIETQVGIQPEEQSDE